MSRVKQMNGWAAAALIGTLVVGCSGRSVDTNPSTQPNRITSEEIRQVTAQNAYQLIQQLRPNWLQAHTPSLGTSSRGQVLVYVDNTRMGGIDFLRQVSIAEVETAEYLNAAEAASRFGLNQTGGAILVKTRR